MDIDGTLTDGKIYMGAKGEVVKAFDIKDGCGIKLLLPKNNIIPAVITARKSQILEKRCQELGIKELYQDYFEKTIALKEIQRKTNIALNEMAFIGDDLPDVPCAETIKKHGGTVMAPANAIQEIKRIADYVSFFKAGEGAVRDCIEHLLAPSKDYSQKIQQTVTWIVNNSFDDISEGITPDGYKYAIQEYATKNEDSCTIESHRHCIDIQYILEGSEILKTYKVGTLSGFQSYDAEKDFEIWKRGTEATLLILVPHSVIVIFNGEPHKGAVNNGTSQKVRKLVCKIPVNNK